MKIRSYRYLIGTHVQGSTGQYRAVQGSIGQYRAALGSIGQHSSRVLYYPEEATVVAKPGRQ